MTDKYTPSEIRIFNEYVIAEHKNFKNGNVKLTLVPTYVTEQAKKITKDYTELSKIAKGVWWCTGTLVLLDDKGRIKPVKYDLRKCDIMLVTGADYLQESLKRLTLMGKKFGLTTIDLPVDFTEVWEQKFFGTQRGDKVLVCPISRKIANNEYEILRNYTMERKITEFFESQRQH